MALKDTSAKRCAWRSVMVTGATGGIGAATALRMAGLGWDVIGTVRSQEKADVLAAAAARRGLGLRTVVLDVADPVSCQEAMARVEEMTGGGVWAVVNNAGVPQAGSVEDVSDEQARHLLEVNLLGAMRICRLALPGMRRRGGGRIVNVSSGLGRVPWPMGGWYCASKHALSAITHCLRVETAHAGVRVSLVEPGAFATAMLDRAVADLADTRPSGGRAGYDRSRDLFTAVNQRVPGPEPVARVIAGAVSARRPRARYTVGLDARFLIPLHTMGDMGAALLVEASAEPGIIASTFMANSTGWPAATLFNPYQAPGRPHSLDIDSEQLLASFLGLDTRALQWLKEHDTEGRVAGAGGDGHVAGAGWRRWPGRTVRSSCRRTGGSAGRRCTGWQSPDVSRPTRSPAPSVHAATPAGAVALVRSPGPPRT
ncbi:Estradiol 17-beta-dehydrogenase [Actinobacteria bacterium OV320]|nr:Estradiol 17-beta-dehydrogenase [Actinobacteria bacterium OV320]